MNGNIQDRLMRLELDMKKAIAPFTRRPNTAKARLGCGENCGPRCPPNDLSAMLGRNAATVCRPRSRSRPCSRSSSTN